MAVVVFLVTNILLAVLLLLYVEVESGTAGAIEVAGGVVAVFVYWRWSDPKRREGKEPPMSDLT